MPCGALRFGCTPSAGTKPAELYGKITWKIDKFSQISKRELRSDTFDAGNYKWCAPHYSAPVSIDPFSLFACTMLLQQHSSLQT